ncbi:MAG: GHKL domain-containing protein [Anaerostipes sp.]|nr:GHKL domain-containing protein [Anaerostipes sp.]
MEEVFSFILVLTVITIRKRFQVKKIQYTYSDVALGAMVLIGVIACIGPFLSEGFQNWTSFGKRLEILLGFLLMLIGISTIIFRICKVRQKQEQFEQQMLWNERLLNEQKKYYELLLQKEEMTKKIRHDMKSQLGCLGRFLEKEEYGQAKEYLGELIGGIQRLNILVSTGNDVVDIVVNDIVQGEKMHLNWKGKIPSKLNMTNAEICILFSNLLKNAAEAVRDVEDKTVNVTIKIQGHHLLLEESNQTIKPVIIEEGRLQTTKHDKEKHGIGSRNVREIVEKYNGSVSYHCEAQRFQVNIILLDAI